MSQQVWAFFASNDESWPAPDLARKLDMPLSTVRGQLRRLERDGKVVRHQPRYAAGRVLYRRAEA